MKDQFEENVRIVEKIVYLQAPVKLMIDRGIQYQNTNVSVKSQTEEDKEEQKVENSRRSPVKMKFNDNKLEISSV
jgi:hypothetical protein